MKPENRRIFYIVALITIVVLAIVLGLVFGLKSSGNEEKPETPVPQPDPEPKEEEIDVLNLYNNTAELIKKFPVINNTTVITGTIEEKIQNRLLTGFENWNRGFKTWKAWGNILYTNDSIYNVHGARLSLAHYQAAMDVSLQRQTILMGDFHNMLISDNFTAIHYDFITVTNGVRKVGKVMEFVRFMDYGEELGTRVVEGWGSTKDTSYNGLINFQVEEKTEQEKQDDYNLKYQIPEGDNLTEKYVIKYPTKYVDQNANDILQIVLKGFDNWNKGIDYYVKWVEEVFDENATSSSLDERNRTMEEYKKEMKELFGDYTITKLYFDNVLIRDNWAAMHYRYRREDKTKNINAYVGDRMEFYKFEEKDKKLKIVGSWIQ